MAVPQPAKGEGLLERLADAFKDGLRRRDPEGRALTRLADPEDAADAAASLLVDTATDTGEVWAEHLGGFYDVEAVRRLLGAPERPVTKQAVSKRRGLLALHTGSGRVVYPCFQFVDGHPVDGLGEVLDVLPPTLVDRWTLASWLVSEDPELDGERAIDVLAAGHKGAVLAAARSWAAALAA